jgi:(1->4)-alpha-D-glucan 1-alpha-D-glucosylmutase
MHGLIPAAHGWGHRPGERLPGAGAPEIFPLSGNGTAMRIASATYRLQFHRGFRFQDAVRIVPYLHRLGITDVYASPITQAKAGSLHGYDVTNHALLNPELGTEDDFKTLSAALRGSGMGLIVDVVPNHMEIDDPANAWWQNVLENGRGSPFAAHFDIDWDPPKQALRNRVLLPFLGDQYGRVLENGEISLLCDRGAFFVAYFERRYPIDPRTATVVLNRVAERLHATLAADDPHLAELDSILTVLRNLPQRNVMEAERVDERQREKEVAKRRLAELLPRSATICETVETVIRELSGRAGDARSFDALEELLADQPYRLCHWRVAADEINYRRFFDINSLAAICVERPQVFADVHGLILRLLGEGHISGLRIDHPDGLFDPEQYFAQLQAECRAARAAHGAAEGDRRLEGDPALARGAAAAPGSEAVPASAERDADAACYVVVEKILSHGEQLPEHWDVHGTTGYEALNLINGVFVDRAAEKTLYGYYGTVCYANPNFRDLVYESKKLVLGASMSSQLHVLARKLDRISEQHRWSRDFTLRTLTDALGEVIACFPVYRTYVRLDDTEVSEADRRHIETAIRAARRRNHGVDRSLFEFIRSVLLLENPDGLSETDRAERRQFVMQLQQLTGPVMAKGLEDTAFYRVYPLASLNEVGGEPQHFGTSVEALHRANQQRAANWPHSMVSSATHDTKRSEDVRAWINVLSEIPDEWIEAVERWRAYNQDKRTLIEERFVPDPNEEYLLYQTLVGTWPLAAMDEPAWNEYVQRIARYMDKAAKEAKLQTSWFNPDEEHDEALARFVRDVLDRGRSAAFLDDLSRFRAGIDRAGMCNSLAQLVLKMTVPGVPDFYQGTELWHFRLVDPDNREPVDFEAHAAALDQLTAPGQEPERMLDDLLEHWRDGRIKLFVTHRGLNFRRRQEELFRRGEYAVPQVTGERTQHVCSFLRRHAAAAALAVVPRLTHRLTFGRGELPLGEAIWEDTALRLPHDAPRSWRNILTGETIEAVQRGDGWELPLAQVLRRFPVAICEGISAE